MCLKYHFTMCLKYHFIMCLKYDYINYLIIISFEYYLINFIVFFAGMAKGSLVLGFLPIRADRSYTDQVPNPVSETLFPFCSDLEVASKKASKAF